jgi:hypothetical protein
MIIAAILSFICLVSSLAILFAHEEPYRSVGEYVAVAVFATATVVFLIGGLI